MTTTRGHAARNFLHNISHNHHPSLPRSSKTHDKNAKAEQVPDYQKRKEAEKHFIAQWEADNSREPLSPSQIAKDPSEKHVGQSSKYLHKEDFKLIKTIGTGW